MNQLRELIVSILFRGLLLILFLQVGCKESVEVRRNEKKPALRFTYEIKKYYYPVTEESEDPILPEYPLILTLRHPVILNPEEKSEYQAFAKYIDSLVLIDPILGTEHYSTWKDLLESYKSEYKEIETDVDTGLYWYSTRIIEILDTNSFVIAIKTTLDQYMGGAHENCYINCKMYNLAERREVPLEYFLKSGSYHSLVAVAERKFRIDNDILPGNSLSDGDFWFEDDIFQLPENFWFDRKGLHFVYNEYEIAPYSMGSIQLDLPYSIINHLINTSELQNWINLKENNENTDSLFFASSNNSICLIR